MWYLVDSDDFDDAEEVLVNGSSLLNNLANTRNNTADLST
jgi:hypothetical protein